MIEVHATRHVLSRTFPSVFGQSDATLNLNTLYSESGMFSSRQPILFLISIFPIKVAFSKYYYLVLSNYCLFWLHQLPMSILYPWMFPIEYANLCHLSRVDRLTLELVSRIGILDAFRDRPFCYFVFLYVSLRFLGVFQRAGGLSSFFDFWPDFAMTKRIMLNSKVSKSFKDHPFIELSVN